MNDPQVNNRQKTHPILRKISNFKPFRKFSFRLLSPTKFEDSQIMINKRLMRIFVKLSSSLVKNLQFEIFLQLKIFELSSDKSDRKGMLVRFLETLFISSFATGTTRFSKFDAGDVVLFQIKVSGRNIKGTTLTRYFINVTARPSFRRLRVIRRINTVH